jgi:hypothetical protein
MEPTARAALFTTLLVGLLGGCGGSGTGMDAGGGSDAVLSCSSDQTRRIADLTTTSDRQAFCDCVAAVGGGYGQSKHCDGGIVVKTMTDQATCVARFGTMGGSCAATIADALACATELQQCNLTGSACQTLTSCNPPDAGM